MPATTCSKATTDQEATSTSMENRLAKLEDKLKKAMEELEALQHENEALKHRNMTLGEDVVPSKVDRAKAESQSTGRPLNNDEEKKKMHHDLWSLMDKYK